MNLNLKDSGTARDSGADNQSSQNDVPVLRRAAMDYLARREHSVYELQQKISRKFPDAETEVLQQVLSKLRQENLQSDDRFAEAYARYRKTRGFGYLHVRLDLLSRRVDESIVEKYLHPEDAEWKAIAEALVLKKLGESEKLEFGSKRHKKLLRFFESRGFSMLEIRRVLEPRLI
ncbi:MAG: regulatory protein RecX [Pseudohongiella sp.]|nr:regulatory protein RecX [Pseudohongiella sp.]